MQKKKEPVPVFPNGEEYAVIEIHDPDDGGKIKVIPTTGNDACGVVSDLAHKRAEEFGSQKFNVELDNKIAEVIDSQWHKTRWLVGFLGRNYSSAPTTPAKYALFTEYSFDASVPVMLFGNEDDAKKALQSIYDEEISILRENHKEDDYLVKAYCDEESGYAVIVDCYGETKTEWRIAALD